MIAAPGLARTCKRDFEGVKVCTDESKIIGVPYKMLQQFDDLAKGDRTQSSSGSSLIRSLLGRQHEQPEHGDEDEFQRRIVGQINGQLADLRKIAEDGRQ